VTLRKITGNAVALQEGSQVAVTEADPVIGVQYHCWRQQRINQVTGWNRDLRGRYVRNRITRHFIYLTEFFSAKSSLWSRPVLTKVLRTGVDAAVPCNKRSGASFGFPNARAAYNALTFLTSGARGCDANMGRRGRMSAGNARGALPRGEPLRGRAYFGGQSGIGRAALALHSLHAG